MTEPQTAKPAKATANARQPRTSYSYVGYNKAGEWDIFSDELEASRFALKGADGARVEKREVHKRAK